MPASTLVDLGAGTGATVGKLSAWCAMRGGIGTAWVKVGRVTVGALVAVNVVGDVIDPSTGTVVAGTWTADGRRGPNAVDAILRGDAPLAVQAGMAPTTGVVAMDAVLTKAQARTLAQMAHDGFRRAIEASHTMRDGDTLFAMGKGRSGLTGDMMTLGVLAAWVTAAAVRRTVFAAKGLSGTRLPDVPPASDPG